MKKSFSILLSFILLTSHMYLAIGTHFCGDEAMETKILIGQTHLGCNMPGMDEPVDESDKANKNGLSFNEVPCCENEFQIIPSTNEFVKDVTPQAINLDFTVAFIYTSLNLDLYPESTHQFYTEYIPPPLEKDIQVLFQTFLI